MSLILPPEHTCHDAMSCSSCMVIRGLEALANLSHLGDSKETATQQGCRLLCHIFGHPRVAAMQRWSISFLAYTRLEEISYAPLFHFVAIFSPPSLIRYSNCQCMKERWRKSNQSIIAIGLSAWLLFAYCVAQRRQQQTRLWRQHMSTTSPSCTDAQAFILWVITWQTTISSNAMTIQQQSTPSAQAHESKPLCPSAQAFSANT